MKHKKAQAKKEQLQKVVNNLQNSKVFWTEIRALPHLFCEKTNIDPQQWFRHFKGVFISDCVAEAYDEADIYGAIVDDELDVPISAQEID